MILSWSCIGYTLFLRFGSSRIKFRFLVYGVIDWNRNCLNNSILIFLVPAILSFPLFKVIFVWFLAHRCITRIHREWREIVHALKIQVKLHRIPLASHMPLIFVMLLFFFLSFTRQKCETEHVGKFGVWWPVTLVYRAPFPTLSHHHHKWAICLKSGPRAGFEFPESGKYNWARKGEIESAVKTGKIWWFPVDISMSQSCCNKQQVLELKRVF